MEVLSLVLVCLCRKPAYFYLELKSDQSFEALASFCSHQLTVLWRLQRQDGDANKVTMLQDQDHCQLFMT